MPHSNFIYPYEAAVQLSAAWDIPVSVTEQIVRAVLRGGACYVRGRSRFDFELQDISKEIGATLLHGSLSSLDFIDVEIDWNGLLAHGRKLVPREWEYLVSAAEDRARPSMADAEKALRVWLHQQGGKPPRHKTEIRALAQSGELIGERGKTLGRNGFNRAWDQAAPPAWKRPGPKKKNKTTTRAVQFIPPNE